MTDAELLEQYRRHDRAALATLVSRHLDWVYSVARRKAPQVADDVTQATFIVLAQRPPSLRAEQSLSPWLFKVVTNASRQALRGELRRQRRQSEASAMHVQNQLASTSPWEEMAPHLDDLVTRLSRNDQRLILLRFYEQKGYAQIGVSVGISEEAARKRVSRAIDKLREMFAQRGLTTASSATIAGVLSAELIMPAPAALGSICTLGAAGQSAATPASLLAKQLVSMIFPAKLAAASIAAVLVLAGTMLLLQLKPEPAPAAAPRLPAPANVEYAGPAVLGKLQISAAISTARAKIIDLSVASSMDLVSGGERNREVVRHTWHRITIKGIRRHVIEEHSFGAQPGTQYRTETAFDGIRSIVVTPHVFQATISRDVAPTAWTNHDPFFEMWLLGDPPDPRDQSGGANLLVTVDSSWSSLRDRLELVDGHPCYVLDVIDPRSNLRERTHWLDAERGFVALRSIHYYGQQSPMMEHHVTQVANIGGFWFPLTATKTVYPDRDGDIPETLISSIKVDLKPDGTPDLAVNTGVPDELFKLVERVPEEITIYDSEQRKIARPGTGRLRPGEAPTTSPSYLELDQFIH